MAQRGLGAVFRNIFGSRQANSESQPVAPPDSISSQSHYDTDGSSYSYEEEVKPATVSNDKKTTNEQVIRKKDTKSQREPVSGPERTEGKRPANESPSEAAVPQEAHVGAKSGSHVPLALRRLGADGAARATGQDDTPSSQYSLRPRRRRKPAGMGVEIEPVGVETSFPVAGPASPLPPSGPGYDGPTISVRPSRAAMSADGSQLPERSNKLQRNHRGPWMPAPSAGTTSGIAGRPNLVALGDLENASIDTLKNLCKSVGALPVGDKDELKRRIRAKLEERQVLNEDTQMLDADGNPSGKLKSNDGEDLGKDKPSPKGRAFDLTTTTMNRFSAPEDTWHNGKPDGGITSKSKGQGGCAAKSGDESAHGGIVAKSCSVKGGMSTLGQLGKSDVPSLEIPMKAMSNAGVKGMSNYPPNASSAVGALRPGTPTSTVFKPPHPPTARGRGRLGQVARDSAMRGNPSESVDARGGGPSSLDVQDILRDVSSDGYRRLSWKEFQACVRALEAKVSAPESDRNAEAANLIAAKGFPGASAKSSGKVTDNRTLPEASEGLSSRFLKPAGKPLGDGGGDGSHARQTTFIPPVPPNTPGVDSFAAMQRTGGSQSRPMHGSEMLHRAATHVRALSDPERVNNASSDLLATASLPNAELQTREISDAGSNRANKMRPERYGNDTTSERNVNICRKADATPGLDLQKGDGPVPVVGQGVDARQLHGKAASVSTGLEKNNLIGSSERNKPLSGVFAGAVGGPDVHNTVDRSAVASDQVGAGNKSGPRMDRDSGNSLSRQGAHHASSTPDVSKAPIGCAGAFATPRDVVKAYNRLLGDAVPMDVEEGQTEDTQRLHHTAPHRNVDQKDNVASSPAPVPLHLRGFSAIGTRSATHRRYPSAEEEIMDHSGRVIGPASFRRRRPMSMTSNVLTDLRRSHVAYENKFIASKIMQGSSFNREPSRERPPLSDASLKILAALQRVREENRAGSLKRRPVSEMPIPLSAKRARREGSFTGASTRRDADAERTPVQNIVQNVGLDKRTAARRLPSHTTATPNDTKRRRPMAFGIGKKRSKKTPLSKAALAEIESELKEKDGKNSGAKASKKDSTGFAFGQQRMAETDKSNHLSKVVALDAHKTAFRADVPEPPTASHRRNLFAPIEEAPESAEVEEEGTRPHFTIEKGVVGSPMTKPGGPEYRSVFEKEKSGEIEKAPHDQFVSHANGGALSKNALNQSQLTGGIGLLRETGREARREAISFALVDSKLSDGSQAIVRDKSATPAIATPLASRPTEGADTLGTGNGAAIQGMQGKRVGEGREVEGMEPLTTGNGEHLSSKGTVAPSESRFSPSRSNADVEKNRNSSFPILESPSTQFVGSPERQPLEKSPPALGASDVTGILGQPGKAAEEKKLPVQKEGIDNRSRSRIATNTLQIGTSFGASKDSIAPEERAGAAFQKKETAPPRPTDVLAPVSKGEESNEKDERREAVKSSKGEEAPAAVSIPTANLGVAPGSNVQPTLKLDESKSDLDGKSQGLPFSFGSQSAGSHVTTASPFVSTKPSADLNKNAETLEGQELTKTTGRNVAAGTAPKPFAFTAASVSNSDAPTFLFGSKPDSKSTEPERFAGASNSMPGIFGGSASGPAPSTSTPFTFGANSSSGKPLFVPTTQANEKDALNAPSVAGNLGSAKEVEDTADAMTTSATPPAKSVTFGEKKPGELFSLQTKPIGASDPLFAQPASSAAFASFGGTLGEANAPAKPQGSLFAVPRSEAVKDPDGPFGGPKFASAFSTPNTSTFVFGAAAPQSTPANLTTSGTGSTANNTNTPFAFQKPAISFGSSQAASSVPQFGTAHPQSSSVGGAFGGNVGASPFGSSQPGLSSGPSMFGSSQPAAPTGGLTTAAPTFGSTGQNNPFTGFGSSGIGQQPLSGMGHGPFGTPSSPSGSGQPQFGTFGSNPSAPFAFGGSNPTTDTGAGGFNVGTSTIPGRRPRKLKAKRTFR